jgi:hypothetical protein
VKAPVLDLPQPLKVGEWLRPGAGRVTSSSASAPISRNHELQPDGLDKPIRVPVEERGLFLTDFFDHRLGAGSCNPRWVSVLPPAKVIL